MNKQEFLAELRKGLSGLPQEDIEERLAFYAEIIDDRMEEGLTEVEAVKAIGSVDDIISQIIAQTPLTKLVKEKIKPKKRLKTWEIVLLALGSPIWLSLLIAAFAVVISIYAAAWAVIISFWAVFASVVGCAFGGLVAGVILVCSGSPDTGVFLIGAGLICAGLAILLFFGCKATTNGILLLTKKTALGIKNCFVKKEGAK